MRADSPEGMAFCLDLLGKLVDMPSVFPFEQEIMLSLEHKLKRLDLNPMRIPVDGDRFNLLCSVGTGKPRICLNAHSDTVPANGGSVPGSRIESDNLYGLGACDDKASVAAMATAFLDIASRSEEIGAKVDLLISVDEEGDALGVRRAIEQGYSCDYAIVGEPTNLDVVCVHAGILFLKLATSGFAAHGSSPQNGVNAIRRMIELVDEIEPVVMSFAPHIAIGPPSLNLGEINAGNRPNRVPDSCTARIDIRLAPPARVSDMLAAVREVVDSKGWASLEVEKRGEPLDTPPSSPLVEAILTCAAASGRQSRIAGWRGWTEAEVFRSELGVDAVVFGPGSLAQAHSADEYVSIQQVHAAASLYVGAVERLSASAHSSTREDNAVC